MSDKLRLPYDKLSPAAYKGFSAVSEVLHNCTLDKKLTELVWLRISQINGCAFCLAMHSSALVQAGEKHEKLHTVAGWRLSPHFGAAERAALQWAESLTNISETHAPDVDYLPLKQHFNDAQIADLTMAIALMNAWNRIAVGMQQ